MQNRKNSKFLNQLTYFLLSLIFLLNCGSLKAEPLVVTKGSVVFDWGRLFLRYQGYTIPSSDKGVYFTELEGLAFFKGMTKVKAHLSGVYQNFLAENELSQKAKSGEVLSPQYERYSFITERVFFANSGLNVAIVSPMSRLFSLPEYFFKPVPQQEVENQKNADVKTSAYTGVVLALNQATAPKAMYRIVDEEFNLLFSYANLSHEAFAENLMGRWYQSPSSHEIRAVAGEKPIEIKLKVLREGLFQFDTRGSSMGKDKVIELLSMGNLMLKF